ncbi:MAG TPA: hypothetical protein PK154_06750 [Methanoregulaceae archaeon]|nr:hypothetical protein [Methanoregulaceae archaeon]HQM56795.1 hypothetical protein [Methanoregulaceae archaeon]
MNILVIDADRQAKQRRLRKVIDLFELYTIRYGNTVHLVPLDWPILFTLSEECDRSLMQRL